MVKISIESLQKAITRADNLSIDEKVVLFDKIYIDQPNVLASILVQKQLGNSLEHIEVLLNILLVSYLSLEEAGISIVQISEEEQELQMEMLVTRVSNIDSAKVDSIKDYINANSERLLFAYACDEMTKAGLLELQEESSKYLIMAGINIVNCIAAAKLA